MKPYYADDQITLWHGDALDVLRDMPDGSVNCCVTSPPYYGLRDYGEPGQYGLEPTPAAYVETMRLVFAEVRRVLAADGTLWLNLGDSYYSGKGSPTQPDLKNQARRPPARILDMPGRDWAQPKSLLGIPWRVAFGLQDDGWILRNAIVWDKPNAMPESVTDRLSATYEYVFLLARSPRYWFDLDAIREPYLWPECRDGSKTFGGHNGGEGKVGAAARRGGLHPSTYGLAERDHTPYPPGVPGQRGRAATGSRRKYVGEGEGRNPGDVWVMPTQPFPAAHFAVMAPLVAERCIQAGCRPAGVVLDPFCGSGTSGMVALKHGRRFVGVDLSAKYLDLALRTRLAQTALIEGGAA